MVNKLINPSIRIYSATSKSLIYLALASVAYCILSSSNGETLGFYFTLNAIQLLIGYFDIGIKSNVHSVPKSTSSENDIKQLIKWFIRTKLILILIILLFKNSIINLFPLSESSFISKELAYKLINISIYTSITRSISDMFVNYYYYKGNIKLNALVDIITATALISLSIFYNGNRDIGDFLLKIIVTSGLAPLLSYLIIINKFSAVLLKHNLNNLIRTILTSLSFKSSNFPNKKISFQFFLLQLSTLTVNNLSPILIANFSGYSITGLYRLHQVLFNGLSAALLGYYIYLWSDSARTKDIIPIEKTVERLKRISFIPILIGLLFSLCFYMIFKDKVNTNLVYLIFISVVASLSFIFSSFQLIYSLFLNGSGYPLYTCYACTAGAIIFIFSAWLFSYLQLQNLTPLSFLLANLTSLIFIYLLSYKANNKIKSFS